MKFLFFHVLFVVFKVKFFFFFFHCSYHSTNNRIHIQHYLQRFLVYVSIIALLIFLLGIICLIIVVLKSCVCVFFCCIYWFLFFKVFFLVCVLAKNDAKKPIFASHKRGLKCVILGMLYLVYILRLFGKEIIPKKNSFCNYFVEHLKNGIIFEEGGGRGREGIVMEWVGGSWLFFIMISCTLMSLHEISAI